MLPCIVEVVVYGAKVILEILEVACCLWLVNLTSTEGVIIPLVAVNDILLLAVLYVGFLVSFFIVGDISAPANKITKIFF